MPERCLKVVTSRNAPCFQGERQTRDQAEWIAMGRDEILRTWFMAELAHAREQGIAVDVEGVPYEDQTPDEVWELMQKRNYMLDYEGDDTGRIVALHIELLKPLKNPEKMRYKFTNGR